MTKQVHLLNVRRVVVEDELCQEVVVSRLARIELEADNAEALAVNKADVRERLECLSGILQDLVVNGRIARVLNLDSLVHRLTRATRREVHHLRRAELDHGDECLRARRERVTDHPEVVAEGRVDVLAHGVFVLRLLD